MRSRKITVLMTATIVMATMAAAVGQAFTIYSPVGAVNGTLAWRIDSSGRVVGIYFDANHVQHGFARSSDGTIIAVDPPHSTMTFVAGSTQAGQIGGTYFDSSQTPHGFVRGAKGGYQSFKVKSAPTHVTGINALGWVVGFYGALTGAHGFLRNPNGKITLFDPSGSSSTLPKVINTGGEIAGTYIDAHGAPHGFVRDEQGNLTSFIPEQSSSFYVNSINASNEIVGSYTDSNNVQHGYMRDAAGTITSFDIPGSSLTNSYDINNKGVIVGLYRTGNIDQHGFARKADGSIVLFDAPGASETIPVGINDGGLISGSENAANGIYQGFLYQLPQ
jgi:hypothetical protein